jgi:hypothetical protein
LELSLQRPKLPPWSIRQTRPFTKRALRERRSELALEHREALALGGSSSKGSDDCSSPDEGSASFRTPGGDDSIQNFGSEADSSKVEAATGTLGAHLRARAKDDWAKSWTYPAKAAVQPLERLASSSSQLKGKGCAAILAALKGQGLPGPGPIA